MLRIATLLACIGCLSSRIYAQDPLALASPKALNTNAAIDTGGDQRPRVATDGLGHWVAVWDSTDKLNGTLGSNSDSDILVARSIDNGATWTNAAPLNTNAGTDTGDDLDPDIATDGGGNWIAVWDSNENLGGLTGSEYDIFVARSFDNGGTWTAPAALNTNATADFGADKYPRIDTDGSGNWVTVWQSNDNLGGSSIGDEDIFVATSDNIGASWTAPEALNTNAGTDRGDDTYPNIANDGIGHWVTVWQSNENLNGDINTEGDILVAGSSNDGASWSAPKALNTNATSDSGIDVRPDIATDGSGVWLAVWSATENFDHDSDILVARSTNNGSTWTAPGALNTNASTDSGDDTNPRVVTDGLGNWVTAWASTDDLDGTIGTDSDVLVAHSIDDGTNWSDPQPLNTDADVDIGGDFNPDLATDSAGNWVAVWDSVDPLGGTIGSDSDILTSSFDLATCPGGGCSPSGCGLCGAGLTALMPLLIVSWVLIPRRRRHGRLLSRMHRR
jgi:hypothetical protein